tara:strand:+ start:470 stop:667 length:198 start_codon:yes stop_codon:yes gene_type:complete
LHNPGTGGPAGRKPLSIKDLSLGQSVTPTALACVVGEPKPAQGFSLTLEHWDGLDHPTDFGGKRN